jgi:hypothetical protein
MDLVDFSEIHSTKVFVRLSQTFTLCGQSQVPDCGFSKGYSPSVFKQLAISFLK